MMTKRLRNESMRVYSLAEIKHMLQKMGLRFRNVYAGFQIPPVKFNISLKTANIIIIARNY